MPFAPTPDSFWHYSTRLYALPGVEPACLRLQQRFGLDVNMLLFCCWLGSQARGLPKEAWPRAVARTGRWQAQAVRPLRELRRRLKPLAAHDEAAAALRKALAECELQAERIEQLELAQVPAAAAQQNGAPAGQAVANLAAYLAQLSVRLDRAGLQDVQCLLAQAFVVEEAALAQWLRAGGPALQPRP